MATYHNRVNGCTPCSKKQEQEVKPKEPEVVVPIPKVTPSIENISCGKKILSISEVKGKVVVMYDDCSYSVTDKELVQLNLDKPKVVAITEANGKVLITLDNGNYLEAELSSVSPTLNTDVQSREELDAIKQKIEALEGKEDKDTIFDDTELKDKLAELEKFKEAIITGLVDIQQFNGEVSFKALSKDINLTGEKTDG